MLWISFVAAVQLSKILFITSFPSPTSSLQNQISIIVRSIIDQNEEIKVGQISIMVIQLVLLTVTN